jgi:ABC-2 type transport system ATP-binding protein
MTAPLTAPSTVKATHADDASTPRPDQPAIVVDNLSKGYNGRWAIWGMSFTVPRGAIYGLIGPNGAGKTTTFSILASILKADHGGATVCGYDTQRRPREVRAKLGYMPDAIGVYDGLRVQEYLRFFAGSYGIPRAQWPALVDSLLELVDLTGKRHEMVNSLSRGMKQRLSLARALVHDPEVLVLDEPASGLDPRARVELRELLLELRSMDKTIVISSHILADLQEICTDVGIIEAGRLLASGSPASILDNLGTHRQLHVVFLDGTRETFDIDNDVEQATVIGDLVREGREVLECKSSGGNLEELFMSITEGRVQ